MSYTPPSVPTETKHLSRAGMDPYFDAKNQVQRDVGLTLTLFEKWKNVLETTNTSKNATFGTLTGQLKGDIKKCMNQLNAIEQTIKQVQANPDKFEQISTQDLETRTGFVSEMRKQIKDVKNTIKSDRTKRMVADHKRTHQQQRDRKSGLERERDRQNEYMTSSYDQKQQVQEVKQDEIAADMLQSLKRLGVMGNTIQVELEEQAELLDELDDGMDNAGDKLAVLHQKLEDLLGDSITSQFCIILFLIGILILLMYFTF